MSVTTIALADQLKASRAMYDRAFANIETLSDDALRDLLASVSTETAVRLISSVSPEAAGRILDGASPEAAVRILASVSPETVGRIISNVSPETVGRIISNVSTETTSRILASVSPESVGRILASASPETAGRIIASASPETAISILASVSPAITRRILASVSPETAVRISACLNLHVPVVPNLDALVCEQVDAGRLDMGAWHCGTRHCRAGLAVTFAGDAGQKLESVVGSEMAGRLIYEASTGRPAPNFHASNADAIADIRRCAAEYAA